MTEPKILFFDLETSPMLAYTFSLWKTTIGIGQIKQGPRVICWSAKWYGKKNKVKFMSEYHDDYISMLVGIRDLLDEADVVVGYNSDNFDVRWMNEQFLSNNIELPSPFAKVDLYKLNKKHLYTPSGKLDYLSFDLLGENKLPTNFSLWLHCIDPDVDPKLKADAWKRMKMYAMRDSALLEPLFDIFRPFISSLNYGLYSGKQFVCTHCGSSNLNARGFAFTTAGKYQRYVCKDCGSWSKDPKRIETTSLRPMANS